MLPNFFTTNELAIRINSLASTASIGDNIYLADIADVLIIAALIYIALFFLKQTRSLLALVGIGIMIALYAIAQIFNLYLTALTLQTFFSIFFIILAIVFQEELRRFFEFLASISTRQRKKKPTASSATVKRLVQATANLAYQKRGAIIVMTGKENIERHLDGGQLADAIISENLLESIFDPNSVGHDGAVIVNKDRIVRFGTHLPLSVDFKQLKERGTRHSAALGLAERTDALIIAVSEERGEISVAYDGKITILEDPEELTHKLNSFLQEKFPEQPVSMLENMVKKNSGIKLAALGISFMIWFFSVFQAETIQRDFVVPVAYRNVPETVVIKNTEPNEVVVTMAGRGEAAFNRLDTSSLKITIDGAKISDGPNTIDLTRDMIELPFPISIIDITPARIKANAQIFTLATVPISIDTTGSLPEDIELDSITTSTRNIEVLVPEYQDTPETLFTEKIDLSEIDKNKTLTTKLALPGDVRLTKEAKNEITVSIIVRKKE